MSSISTFKAPVAREMDTFEKVFRQAMASKVPLLDRITHYIVKRKGKQLRPMLVFLTAKLHGEINDSSYRGASLIELMHTATLVHDDVVDDANLRRGFFSINALWKNKIAVLVGDYLLSKVLLLAVEHKEHRLLELVSTSVREMSEGELLQIEKARRLDVNEDIYYEIIRQKTASLIASCCAVGAASTGATDEEVKRMHRFGELLGMAFQIKDDLFDYDQAAITGKPTGIDIKEQKMTLPLLYALGQANGSDRRRTISTVKRHHNNPQRVQEVMDFVRRSGGIDYAQNKMGEFHREALELLEPFPDSDVKEALIALTHFVIDRKK